MVCDVLQSWWADATLHYSVVSATGSLVLAFGMETSVPFGRSELKSLYKQTTWTVNWNLLKCTDFLILYCSGLFWVKGVIQFSNSNVDLFPGLFAR